MQKVPAYQFRFAAVGCISHDRIAYRSEMHTYLVRAPGLRTGFRQRVSVIVFESSIFRARRPMGASIMPLAGLSFPFTSAM